MSVVHIQSRISQLYIYIYIYIYMYVCMYVSRYNNYYRDCRAFSIIYIYPLARSRMFMTVDCLLLRVACRRCKDIT